MFTSHPISLHLLVQSIAEKLHKKYQDQFLCIQYAWWALEAITEQSKTDLLLQREITLTPAQCDTLQSWIKSQVEHHIPLQYLLGSVPFIDCTIFIEPPILIPRPETEEWCVALIGELEQLPHQELRILDLCTGSGCIAIALAKAFPKSTVYASDISDQALAVARKNAEHNNVSVEFITSDLFTAIPKNLFFDIIVANPPYVSATEWHHLDPSVKTWEDTNALVAPNEGVGVIQQIVTESRSFLDPESDLVHYDVPQLTIEIGHTQGERVKQLLSKAGYTRVTIRKDSSGNDRVVQGYGLHVEHKKR